MRKILFTVLVTTFSLMHLHAQDWANLEKFAFDNAKVKMMSDENLKVVLMGNSITEFWPQISPSYFEKSPFINRGISGQTTPQMLVRFRPDVIDLNPEVVVILAGINDVAGNTGPMTIQAIANNIFSMAELAMANDIKVVLCTVLPANRFSWQPDLQPAGKVIALNEKLEKYAIEKEITYLDYYSSMVDEEKGLKLEYGEDGVHPNAEGYREMERLLDKKLAELME